MSLSTASAPEFKRFLEVVRNRVLSLTPPIYKEINLLIFYILETKF